MNAVNSAMLNLRTVIALFLCLALFACGSSADEVKHKSQEELELGYFYYEGGFSSNGTHRTEIGIWATGYKKDFARKQSLKRV